MKKHPCNFGTQTPVKIFRVFHPAININYLRMKIISVVLIAILLSLTGNSAKAQEKGTVSSVMNRVTVFNSGAQITEISDIPSFQGIQTFSVKGLSPYIDEQSLQVRGKGKFIVLSAVVEKNYLAGLSDKEQIAELRKKIEDITLKLEDERLQTGILREQESFLLSNKEAGGKNENLDAANFKTLYEFYRISLSGIRTDILTRERKIRDLEKDLAKLNNQISEIQIHENLPSAQVIVNLKADSPASGSLEISYFVQGAGWYPSYDIRIEKLSDPVSMIYKANVFQNTGVEWKNVTLSFSSASPNQSGTVPYLYPWYIDFIQAEILGYQRADKKAAPSLMVQELSFDAGEESASGFSAPVGFNTSTRTTSIEFSVDIPYSVPSGGKPKSIDMMFLELPADFEYQSVPKLDPAAFLVGKVRDWQNYDLLEGEANLYFENTYVGKSLLNTGVSDTLNISLGRDQGILVEREKRKEFTHEKSIGPNKVVTRSWEIRVRNNKKENIRLRLIDQIPLSQNKDITVSADELSGGNLDPRTGIVSWLTDIPAGQSKSFVLTYSVKYPKAENVIVE